MGGVMEMAKSTAMEGVAEAAGVGDRMSWVEADMTSGECWWVALGEFWLAGRCVCLA